MAKRLSKIKLHQDIHAKIYNDKNSKPQQEHRLGTVSKNLTRGLKSILRGHNPRPSFCRGIYIWVSKSSAQHLRENVLSNYKRNKRPTGHGSLT